MNPYDTGPSDPPRRQARDMDFTTEIEVTVRIVATIDEDGVVTLNTAEPRWSSEDLVALREAVTDEADQADRIDEENYAELRDER